MQPFKRFWALIFAFLLLAGCGGQPPAAAPRAAASPPPASSAPPELPAQEATALPAGRAPLPLENASIAAAADAVVAQLLSEGMTPEEELRAAYLYVIAHTYFADPVGLDLWRYRGDPSLPPPYLENRALSPLFFGIGSCEDFAAALTVLLRRMGYQAEYVSGLTISVEGLFVDHAWTVVRLDGRWYHLDAQLEQNVTRESLVRFRYFLKDDRTLLADHRWGENLAAYWGGALTSAQRGTLLQTMTPPACPESFSPAPTPQRVTLPTPPDAAAVLQAIAAEKTAYEQLHGPLAPLELHTTPPIYALLPKP